MQLYTDGTFSATGQNLKNKTTKDKKQIIIKSLYLGISDS
jgi:hypothetical protein